MLTCDLRSSDGTLGLEGSGKLRRSGAKPYRLYIYVDTLYSDVVVLWPSALFAVLFWRTGRRIVVNRNRSQRFFQGPGARTVLEFLALAGGGTVVFPSTNQL